MRKEIPRSPRTIAKKRLNGQAPQASPPGWFLKYGAPGISALGAAISVIALIISFAQNGPAILKNAGGAIDWFQTDRGFTGYWTNDGEGVIGAEKWTTNADDAVSFNILVERGKVQGESTSDRFCPLNLYGTLQVDGLASGDQIDGFLYQYVARRKVVLAQIHMDIDRKLRVVTVTTVDQRVALLPASFKLAKWDQPDHAMAPHICMNYSPSAAGWVAKPSPRDSQAKPSSAH
jgi:hypothetical protein